MCPVCLASVGMIVAGVTSAGGLTALAVKLSRKKQNVEVNPNSNERSNEDVNQNSR
jgi:hypothetical protein